MEQGIDFGFLPCPPPPTAPTHPLQPPLVGSPGHCTVTVSFLAAPEMEGLRDSPSERSGASHTRP